jgi:hypothetical protein
MNNDRIDYLLNQILSGILIFYYKDQEYVLHPPSYVIKYKSGILWKGLRKVQKVNI